MKPIIALALAAALAASAIARAEDGEEATLPRTASLRPSAALDDTGVVLRERVFKPSFAMDDDVLKPPRPMRRPRDADDEVVGPAQRPVAPTLHNDDSDGVRRRQQSASHGRPRNSDPN